MYLSFRWICIYPAYINSKKTLAQGRRINKDKAVENPTHQEIRDVLVAAGMKVGYFFLTVLTISHLLSS